MGEPDIQVEVPVVPPFLRVPAQDQSVNFPAYGPAKDTTVQAVHTALGTPAQDATVGGVTTQLATNGAQPFVPNLDSVSKIHASPGVYTLHTVKAVCRLWTAILSASAGSNNNYTNTVTTQMYAQLLTGSGLVLATLELIIAGPNQGAMQTCVTPLNGIEIAIGDTFILDVNGNTGVTNVLQRCSGAVNFAE